MLQKVIVILGQTATGKGALAVKIAKKVNGEIISADSRQIYKNLDIGTGKITKAEMRGVPHHLLDVANPKRRFTVAEYQKVANSAIADITTKNKVPIICGGTGFYIDAVARGVVFPEVLPNNKLRKELAKKSAPELLKILRKLDSARAKNIDPKNKIRIIRAIEIAKALGFVPTPEARPMGYEFMQIGLHLPTEQLKIKVTKRVKKMFKQGLLKEIEMLKKMGISKKRLAEFGFEYNEPTEEKVITETLKYAKRQMTWFKRDKEIKWFTPDQEKNISSTISAFLRAKSE